jgi:hypothetical protein
VNKLLLIVSLFLCVQSVVEAGDGWNSIPNREDYRGYTRVRVPPPIPNLYNPAQRYRYPGYETAEEAVRAGMGGREEIERIIPKGRENGGDNALVYKVETAKGTYEVRVKEREAGNYRNLSTRSTFTYPPAPIKWEPPPEIEPKEVTISTKVITDVTRAGRESLRRYIRDEDRIEAEQKLGVEGLAFGEIWLGEIYAESSYEERGGNKKVLADFLIEVLKGKKVVGYAVHNLQLLRENEFDERRKVWTVARHHTVYSRCVFVQHLKPSEVTAEKYSFLNEKVIASCADEIIPD